MIYGFDLDGMLDQPQIAALANTLYDRGDEVHVITGGLNDGGEWSPEARVALLEKFGVRYTELHRCIAPDPSNVGVKKGEVCLAINCDLYFDDMDLYLETIKRMSPHTKCVKVLP